MVEGIHPDIDKYVNFMKKKKALKNFVEAKGFSPVNLLNKYYYHLRPVLFWISFFVNLYALYQTEDFGMLDGSLLFIPLSVSTVVVGSSLYFKRRHHEQLVDSLNVMFNDHQEPWMVTTKAKYINLVWKVVMFVRAYQSACVLLYCITPLVVDTVLHHVFNLLDAPLFLPLTFSPLLGPNVTWDAKYYVAMLADIWSGWEIVENLQTLLVSYLVMTVYFLSELTIFKEKVQSLELEEPSKEPQKQLKVVVDWHADILSLNENLKAFLGFPCAFQTLFTSLTLTLTLFTLSTSTSIPLILTYGMGFTFYFCAGLLYCSLGQLLENESEEVFKALYDLPWYRYSPTVRKDFNMMMRQARTPLIIDYHGSSKMNLANFMEILRSSYSYFTLLQSMV